MLARRGKSTSVPRSVRTSRSSMVEAGPERASSDNPSALRVRTCSSGRSGVRSLISSAARLLKATSVTARPGRCHWRRRWRARSVSTRVLPDPAGAMMRAAPPGCRHSSHLVGRQGSFAVVRAERDEGAGQERQAVDDHRFAERGPPLERAPVAIGGRPVGQDHVGRAAGRGAQTHGLFRPAPSGLAGPGVYGVGKRGVVAPLARERKRRRQRPDRGVLYFVDTGGPSTSTTRGTRSRQACSSWSILSLARWQPFQAAGGDWPGETSTLRPSTGSLTGDLLTGTLLTGERLTGERFTGERFTGERFTGGLFTGGRFTGGLFTGGRRNLGSGSCDPCPRIGDTARPTCPFRALPAGPHFSGLAVPSSAVHTGDASRRLRHVHDGTGRDRPHGRSFERPGRVSLFQALLLRGPPVVRGRLQRPATATNTPPAAITARASSTSNGVAAPAPVWAGLRNCCW